MHNESLLFGFSLKSNFITIAPAKQPLADAVHYNNHEVIKLFEKHGAKLRVHH